MIRAFVAVELPADLRAPLERAQAQLRRATLGVKVSWTKIGNLHLTLQFLGYVEKSAIPPVSAALAEVAGRHERFDVRVGELGAFPDVRRPRVVWVGCQDASGQLAKLAVDVQGAMQPLGFTPEQRTFTAHLTLARIKVPRPDDALTRAMDSLTNAVSGTLPVDAVHLLQSELHPEGSIYTKLSSHNLKEI